MQNQSQSISDYDYQLKIVIIGDSGVGKTNILTRFTEDKFQMNYMATIGVEFKIKTLQIDGKKIKLQIWDTAGQDKFRTVAKTYYRGACGIIICYAINDQLSYNNIIAWVNQIKQNLSDQVCKILVGTKNDLESDRKVDKEDAAKLASTFKWPFFECSAKTGYNINAIFDTLGSLIKREILDVSEVPRDHLKLPVKPPQDKNKEQAGGCSC